MPEVIDLLSSTPPRPAERCEPPSSLRRFHSSPPGAAFDLLPPPPSSSSFAIATDDLDLFTYDDDLEKDKSTKRRRLSHEPRNINAKASRNPLFLFSDDIVVSSDGPSYSKAAPDPFGLGSDPIVFTSSAPEPEIRKSKSPVRSRGNAGRPANHITIDDDSGDDIGGNTKGRGQRRQRDNIEDFSDQPQLPDPGDVFDFIDDKPDSNGFSNRTANLLASLGGRSRTNKSKSIAAARITTKQKTDLTEDTNGENQDDLDTVPQPKKTTRKTTVKRTTNLDKEAKAREREEAKAQRERDRQLEKERKQKLKEEKAKEKQLAADIAQANKLKVDKKNSTPEMIADLASTLEETSVGNQAVEYMRRLGVEYSFFRSAIPNIVKWRRKVTAKYNDSLGYWEPCPLQIREESHILCLLPAQELVDMVTTTPVDSNQSPPNNSRSPSASELGKHALRIKRAYPGCTIVYLVEGLTAWMRKNTNSRNRAYQAELRRQLNQPQTSTTTSNRRKKSATTAAPATTTTQPAIIDDDTIEDALLNLQVAHACLIHHTAAPPESAEWIKNFTEHVATVPYRRERMEDNDSAFCMDGGQVKPGENKSDTYIKMLQEVNRVTASMAYGISHQYPSVVELVRSMRREGPGMLEDVKKSANKNGGLTDSRIGPAASKRLYKVFMGVDPGLTDI